MRCYKGIEDFNKPQERPKEVYLSSKKVQWPWYVIFSVEQMLMALRAISKNSPAHQLACLKGSPRNSVNFFILRHVTLKKIWTDFEEIHDLATDSIEGPSEVLFPKSLAWINLFCSLREKQPGYESSRVTLYMRIISYLLYKKPWQLQNVFWLRSGKKR